MRLIANLTLNPERKVNEMEGIGIGVFEPDIGNMRPSKDGKWVSLSAHKSCVESLQADLEAVKRERALAVREIGVKTDLLHKSVKESSGLRKELEALKEENKVLKLTVEHYKSDKNVKF